MWAPAAFRVAALCATVTTVAAKVELPMWFGDGMVFQVNSEYGARSFLNGKASPGEKVMVTFNGGANFPGVADENGDWEVQFNGGGVRCGTENCGNVTVTGESDGDVHFAKNVVAGDVIFCSGQSNMVFPTKFAYNPEEEMATLQSYKNMRFFATARDYSPVPLWNLRKSGCKGEGCAMACDAEPCNQWLTVEQATAEQPGKLPKSPLPNTFLANFSAVCFLTVRDVARMHTSNRPMALIQSAWGGTRVEAWMSAEAIAKATPSAGAAPPPKTGPNNVSVLYNAMVAPWNKYSVRAALWYQGEANADQRIKGNDQTQYYSAMYQGMIADWRERKAMGDFAFMTVQLPPSVDAVTPLGPKQDTGRMQIRLAEADTAPHSGGLTDISGVAVALDCGGKSAWGWDHPPNKNEISRRLALQTVHAAYAQQGRIPGAVVCPGGPDEKLGGSEKACGNSSIWTGPVFLGASASGLSTVHVSFAEFSAESMELRDVKSTNPDGTTNNCTRCCAGNPPFEISSDFNGSNTATATWTQIPAAQTAIAGSGVSLKMTERELLQLQPRGAVTGVRMAWSDFVDCVLVNGDGLPAGPFVTKVGGSAATNEDGRVQEKTVVAEEQEEGAVGTQAVLAAPPKIPKSALSPPMGFNSWNYYHCNIDENTVKAVLDAISTNGMKEAGYEYVNIDDCWQVERFPNNTIQPDPARFPSGMKALADYAHSLGLKFGVYTARGSKTCQNRPGAYNHELIDAKTYCEWGLDYLKNDNCGGTNWPAENTSWIKFQQGFDECFSATGRYIVKSIEYCRDAKGTGGCGDWITDVANLWRTTGDVQNTWASVMGNIHSQNDMASVAEPGHFNDPDMLQVGNIGLTLTEQYTHMTLWCIAGAPLLAGTDLVHASKETLAILANPEVTAIDQDLGKDGAIQGELVTPSAWRMETAEVDPEVKSEVWVKQLADGKSAAVALVNLGDAPAPSIHVTFAEAGLPSGVTTAKVRDLWKKADLGSETGGFTAKDVPSHGSVFVKLTWD